MDTNLASGVYFFKRFPEQSPTENCDIFTNNGNPLVSDARQGGAGTCYFISAIATIAESPQLIKDVFLT